MFNLIKTRKSIKRVDGYVRVTARWYHKKYKVKKLNSPKIQTAIIFRFAHNVREIFNRFVYYYFTLSNVALDTWFAEFKNV